MSKWDLASDIFTDYDGTITDATFKFTMHEGKEMAQMAFVVDEIDGRENPTYENYDLPPGWESQDGGETIVRVDGKDKGVAKSSKWGRFLAAVAACKGAREALGEDAPMRAQDWIGTRWHWEAVEGKPYKFKDRETGATIEGVAKDKNYPTEFLGKDSNGNTILTNTGMHNGNGKVDSLSVLTDLHNPVLESQIKDLAGNLSQGEWFGQAYKLITESGVDPNSVPDLISAMGGRELYVSLGGKG